MTDTRSRSRAFWAGWIAAGVFLLIAAAAAVYAANMRNQFEDVELRLVDAVTKLQAAQDQLVAADTEVTAIQNNLSILNAPDVLEFKMTGTGPAADARGRAFISKSKGVLVSASKLPKLAEGQTYQLWLLTHDAAVTAGVMHADEQGNATAAFDLPSDATAPIGAELSVEAEGGANKPGSAIALSTR